MNIQKANYMRQSIVYGLFVGSLVFSNLATAVLAEARTSRHASEINPTHIIALVNTARMNAGQPSLEVNELVAAAAQTKVDLMVERGEFQHVLEDGTTAWEILSATGYTYQAAGENLAVHFNTAEAVVDAWLASPFHRANIMSDTFSDIGIGIAHGQWRGHDGYFMVQLFASPTRDN